MAEEQTLQVGLVGLGAMGMGMARSLVRAGLPVRAYDLRPEAVEQFEAVGGQGATSVAEAAAGADVFVIVVVNAEQVEDVLFGAGQGAASLPPGSIVMVCSTVSPAFARQTAARLEAMGLEMLDAPISGGALRAEKGEITIMAAGKPALFERAQPVLDAMAAHVYRLGDTCGLGSMMKLVNQVLAGTHIAVAAEALAFGARAGLDPRQMYEVICNSAGNSWMFENRVPHILADDYTPLSAVEIWVKDLDIALQASKEMRFPLFLAATAWQLFTMASGAGYDRLDDTAVIKIYEQMLDFKVVTPPDEGGLS